MISCCDEKAVLWLLKLLLVIDESVRSLLAEKWLPMFVIVHNPCPDAGIDPLPHSAEVSALPISAAAVWAAQELMVQ